MLKEIEQQEDGLGCSNCGDYGPVDDYGLCNQCRDQLDHQQNKDD